MTAALSVRPGLATIAEFEKIRALDRHIDSGRLADCIRRGLVYVLRTEADGDIIGVLRYSLFWQSLPFIDLVYLRADCRGLGYGSLFMQFFEDAMRDMGMTHVMLSTQADEIAQFFYEKRGYDRKGSFLPPEQDADELIFWKKL